MVVARVTLRTDAWDVVYTYLQTTNAITTNNIFSSWNDNLVSDKSYPIVIISPPLVSFEKTIVTGRKVTSNISINIQIYEDNAQDCKSLADNVTDKLFAGRETFAANGLFNMHLEAGDYDSWREGGKKIHRISFDVLFRTVNT